MISNRILFLIALLGALLAPASSYAGKKAFHLSGETFLIEGHTAFVILPEKKPDQGDIPWVWYAPTLLPKHPNRTESWMFDLWLEKGVAIAGIDVGESYGSPDGRKLYSALHKRLTSDYGLAKTPCLLGRSRGGLMLYSWAAENSDKVSGIAGIYPVCNLQSYPGLSRAAGAYRMSPGELEKALTRHNPIDRLAPLAKARVPIHHIHGDSDKVVPLEANSQIVKDRYDKLGGTMTLEIIENGGHDMKAHWFRSRKLVEFVLDCVKPR